MIYSKKKEIRNVFIQNKMDIFRNLITKKRNEFIFRFLIWIKYMFILTTLNDFYFLFFYFLFFIFLFGCL